MVKNEIVDILVRDGHYRQTPGPLRIVDTDFGSHFDGVLIGPGHQGCLILVIDGDSIPSAVIHRRVRSFAMVLDRSGSKRPLTVILVAREPALFAELERLCRVIVVTPQDDLQKALRGLLPLPIGESTRMLNAAKDTLVKQLGGRNEEALIRRLLSAGGKSEEDVEREILDAIDGAIASGLKGD